MHAEGKFSLIRLFTSLAMVGAEWVMWILILLSVFSIGIMFERGLLYRSLSDNLDALAEELRSLLRKEDLLTARKRLERSPSPAAMIALAGLNEADRGPDAASEAMAGATARAKIGLERNLAFLGTIGNNAPFIGLLGTVIGIIQAFDALKTNQSQAAVANAANAVANAQRTLGATARVMGVIAEALVATAIGLFVAIPAVAAFNYFQRRVRGIMASGETLSHVVLAYLRGPHAPVAPYRQPALVTSSGSTSASETEEDNEKVSEKTTPEDSSEETSKSVAINRKKKDEE